MVVMKLKFCVILSTLSLILATPLSFQNANALDDSKVIRGKLTIADSRRYPFFFFGGEDVGWFKMKFVGEQLKVVKIRMNEPPRKGYQYLVGFSGSDSGSRILKNDAEHPFGISYSYSPDQRAIVLRDIPHIKSIPDFLVVYENDYSRSIDGIAIGFEALPDPTNLNPKPTTFKHDEALIVSTIGVTYEWKVGERIEIDPNLINIGNETITLTTYYLPFIVNVYTTKGNIAWLFSCGMPDLGNTAVLEPGIPWGMLEALGTSKEMTTGNCYDIKLHEPGEYVIISHTSFFTVKKGGTTDGETPKSIHAGVYSQPVTIKVLS
jgi:hypothetical protein